MSKREQRVIQAFLNCVRRGEYSEDYAITLIEDNQRYGWLSETAKEAFYEALEPVEEPQPTEPVEEPAEEPQPEEPAEEPAEEPEEA